MRPIGVASNQLQGALSTELIKRSWRRYSSNSSNTDDLVTRITTFKKKQIYIRRGQIGGDLRESAQHSGQQHEQHSQHVDSKGDVAAATPSVLHRVHPLAQTHVLEKPTCA